MGGGSVAKTIDENSSCVVILLLAEVLTSNMCYIAYIGIDCNIDGSMYVEISNCAGNGVILDFCSVL